MPHRLIRIASCAAACLLAALRPSIAAAQDLPEILVSYTADSSTHQPFDWLRGEFAGASEEDKAVSQAAMDFAGACFDTARAKQVAALTGMGVTLPNTGVSYGAASPCSDFDRPMLDNFKTWQEFTTARDRVLPFFRGYMAAARHAELIGGPSSPDLAARLIARPLGEQIVRVGFTDMLGGAGSAVGELSSGESSILMALVSREMALRDHDNTQWLKALVDEGGWPKISDVGERASSQASLLVQHADAEPAFQLRALRLMEPLVKTGEVSRSNYAYFYDRIMLKLTGMQRYGTQAECREGKRQPQKLEDEAAVARYRKEAGLEPLEDYIGGMNKTFGTCPV